MATTRRIGSSGCWGRNGERVMKLFDAFVVKQFHSFHALISQAESGAMR